MAQTVYGDDPSLTLPAGHNLRGQVYQSYDQAGVMTTREVDFKGNSLEISQQMAANYTSTIDWDAVPASALEGDPFWTKSSYDALNRPTLTTLPDGSQLRPTYGKGAYTEPLEAKVSGAWYRVMTGQTFDAKGQRQQVNYGNNTLTQYFYNPKNFRLERLLSLHQNQDELQDLYYTYDVVGNVTTIKDKAQSTNYYNNQAVSPLKAFSYDARYRLLTATGREHIGTTASTHQALPHLSNLPNQSIQNATRRYTQSYSYDKAGNILELDHKAPTNNWKRVYSYQNNATNQLASTTLGSITTNYQYDLRGNMVGLPHLQAMEWNESEELTAVQLNTKDSAYYRYSGGQRVRKVLEKSNKGEERLYLGGVERYREYSSSGTVALERWTLLVEGIAQFDTLTVDNGQAVVGAVPTIRYQYRDHLGSSVIEANEHGQVISYEEYYPYGSSAYRASSSSADLSLKRYRFTDKEKDDETGLYYFGVRYYAAWLGRWTAADPGGFVDGLNLYRYVRNNPVSGVDPDGRKTEPVEEQPPVEKEKLEEKNVNKKIHQNLIIRYY